MYAAAELAWILSRSNDASHIAAYAPQYFNFANEGYVYGAYGDRIANNIPNLDQLQLIVDVLRKHDTSRQAVVALWRPDDLVHALTLEKKDIPCTLTWQFLLRDQHLHLCVNMRSNDVWLGLPYDVFVNTCVQKVVATELGVNVGIYRHNVGSLHIYDKHVAAAREALTLPRARSLPHHWHDGMSFADANKLVDLERFARGGAKYDSFELGLRTPMLHDLFTCINLKWGGSADALHSPALIAGVVTNADHRRSRSGGQDNAGA